MTRQGAPFHHGHLPSVDPFTRNRKSHDVEQDWAHAGRQDMMSYIFHILSIAEHSYPSSAKLLPVLKKNQSKQIVVDIQPIETLQER